MVQVKMKVLANLITPILNMLITLTFLFSITALYASSGEEDDEKYNRGITVSPSHVNFNVDIGKTKTKTIKISNHTGKRHKFSINYQDFDISNEGKSSFMDAGSSDFSLSDLISISPTFVEVEPGSSQEVAITVSVSGEDASAKAAWGVVLIEQMEEKKVLDPGNASGNTVAFGITPTFAFGVWLYQNPPNVENMHVDITNFLMEPRDSTNFLFLSVKNLGDGISFCNAYVELTHLNSGEQTILDGKRYTILPRYERNFVFEIPAGLEKGQYSAVGVMDYKSEEELVAAELEFTLE